MQRKILIGDIHGCLKTLKKLIKKVNYDSKTDQLIFLGDYIDRGKNSKGVLDFVSHIREVHPQTILLRGNHEHMMLRSLKNQKYYLMWQMNGGREALDSFGVTDHMDIDIKYWQLIPTLDYYFEDKDFIAVHAGLNFQKSNPFKDHKSMMWIREFAYDAEKAKNKTIIHGHTPLEIDMIRDQVKRRKKVICLDNGCCFGNDLREEFKGKFGNLCALSLPDYTLYEQPFVD